MVTSDPSAATRALGDAEFVLSLISAKWAVRLLRALEPAPLRRGQLKRLVRGINDDRLDTTLRRHLRFGLVQRAWIDGPQSQEPGYELTPIGRSLLGQLESLAVWDREHGHAARAHANEWDLLHPAG